MGHKVHPLGFRLGVIRDWQAKWYTERHFAEFLQEDLKLRKAIQSRYAEAAISTVDIERQANEVTMTIRTARPGIVIGRGGQRVEETRRYLEKLIGKKVKLNIQEVHQPELDANLVARSIAEQMERRVAFRRAMKQALLRTLQAGAKGVRVHCAGRLGGAEIARRLNMHEGQVPLHTLRADIDYGFIEAHTVMGRIGVKVWIYKGDILPQPKVIVEATEARAPLAIGATMETVTPPSVEPVPEVAPVAKVEEKPVRVVRRRRVKAASQAQESPAEPVTEVSAEAAPVAKVEEKPVRVVRRRRVKAASQAQESPAEPVTEVSAEAAPVAKVEEKPVRVVRRRRVKAASQAQESPAEVSVEAESATEPGESDATT